MSKSKKKRKKASSSSRRRRLSKGLLSSNEIVQHARENNKRPGPLSFDQLDQVRHSIKDKFLTYQSLQAEKRRQRNQ